MLHLSSFKLYKIVFDWDEIPGPFEPRGSLYELLFLLLSIILFTFLIYILEKRI